MLKKILFISGRTGLYKLISQSKTMLIVESLAGDKRRMPVYAKEKVAALSDIAMYTNSEEIFLPAVLQRIKEKENGGKASIVPSSASVAELWAYMEEILPDYDRNRVYHNDIRKLITWYNLLIDSDIVDFTVETEKEEGKETEKNEETSNAEQKDANTEENN